MVIKLSLKTAFLWLNVKDCLIETKEGKTYETAYKGGNNLKSDNGKRYIVATNGDKIDFENIAKIGLKRYGVLWAL